MAFGRVKGMYRRHKRAFKVGGGALLGLGGLGLGLRTKRGGELGRRALMFGKKAYKHGVGQVHFRGKAVGTRFLSGMSRLRALIRR